MPHIPTASYAICPICNQHVGLDLANTDEKGRAVHEDCYVSVLLLQPFNRRVSALLPDSTFADAVAILASTPRTSLPPQDTPVPIASAGRD